MIRYDITKGHNSSIQQPTTQMGKQLTIRSQTTIYLMGFFTAMASFVASYSHVYLSQLAQLIQLKGELAPSESTMVLTIVVSAAFMGEIIGPFMYKALVNYYGERGAMIRCYLVIILAISVQLIQLEVTFLFMSRLVYGVIVGIQASILPLYLNSIAPVSVSGKIGSMNQLLTCYGVITAYILGFLINQDKDDQIRWRILVAFPMVPSILSIISLLYFFPFDSLERHIEHNQTDKLQAYIDIIYKNAQIQDIKHQKTPHTSKSPSGSYRRQRQRYILALAVIASCQMTGINAIFLYAKQLYLQITDGDTTLSQYLILGMAFCQLLACSFSGRFIDSFGRKYLLLRGQLGIIGIMTAIFLVDSWQDALSKDAYHCTLICLFYLHVVVFNFSLGPVHILYAAELVNDTTPVIVTNRILSLTAATTTNYLMHQFGIGPMCLVYAVLSLSAHSYLRDRLRQTKGKSKLQILEMFEVSIRQSQPDQKRLAV